MTDRAAMRERITAAAIADERIVGLLEYGSGSQGRADAWSDLDLDVFVRDEAFEGFAAGWQAWAAHFGALLLAYRGGVGHPWTVYAAEPVPLRVDFDVHRASAIEHMREWPYSPVSVAALVLYDGSDGRISERAAQLVGRSLAPDDLRATFARVSGDFWYYLLAALCKWQRDQAWLARQMFHFEVMQNLFNLLRIEAGAVERWQDTAAAWDAERTLSPGRLRQLQACIPGAGRTALRASMAAAALIGRSACAAIGAVHGWEWPRALADQMVDLLNA